MGKLFSAETNEAGTDLTWFAVPVLQEWMEGVRLGVKNPKG